MKAWLKRHKLISLFLAGLLFATPSIIANHDSLIKVALAAQKKVSELTALTGADSATDDLFLIIDTDATETKNITRDELGIGLGGPMGIVVESVPGTAATATGTDAVGIGDGAVAGDATGDLSVVAIGARSTATGVNAVAIGENATATGANSVAIGGNTVDANSADATGINSVAIGRNALSSALSALSFGNGAVAAGVRTVAFGDAAFAFGSDAVGIGRGARAEGDNCTAIGGNGTDTDSADCSAADGFAIGQHVLADDIGQFIFGSGEFAAQSDASTSIYVLRNSTTDATQTELFADASAGDISVPSDCTIAFDVLITARQTDADDVSAGYTFFGVIDNNAGTTALVGSLGTVTTIGEDVVGWDVTATADDTNDGINILVTGAASDAVQWVARVETVKTCG